MELQCKERVDLLEALRQSRIESKNDGETSAIGVPRKPHAPKKSDIGPPQLVTATWNTQDTLHAVDYPDLSRQAQPPPLPLRPSILQNKGSQSPIERSQSTPLITKTEFTTLQPPPTLPIPIKKSSRTPSPEKRSRMLTTLRGTKDGKLSSKSPRTSGKGRSGPPAASSKAAGLAWDSISRSSGQKLGHILSGQSEATEDSANRNTFGDDSLSRRSSAVRTDIGGQAAGSNGVPNQSSPSDGNLISFQDYQIPKVYHTGQANHNQEYQVETSNLQSQSTIDLTSLSPQTLPAYQPQAKESVVTKARTKSPVRPKPQTDFFSYRNEYQPAPPSAKAIAQFNAVKSGKKSEGAKLSPLAIRQRSPQRGARSPLPNDTSRRPVANVSSPRLNTLESGESVKSNYFENTHDNASGSHDINRKPRRAPREGDDCLKPNSPAPESAEVNEEYPKKSPSEMPWIDRLKHVQKNLPKGVDEGAAKQIFNEIVVQGDEVHWDDVAGLDAAKKALKEAVVYPFLRPDLFLGLREPARGMLLFGPPGTGKTMLARAVATESRSTFFAISASSLTSKWLGESEKLVRALFSLAKALAPSIIFVDEIDSLLSSRGGSSEHESTRRIKTEFLIQWSDLQRAAAGKAQTDKEKQEGDPSRVLVLAATNLPWAIDEAARRRFVRRQYIPLPEDHVRATQLQTLLGHQKHKLNKKDIQVLVELTDGKYTLMLWRMIGLT